MNKKQIFDYDVIYDNNEMVVSCKKNNIDYYPFRGNENMSGMISYKTLKKGLIMKIIELRQMSY